MPAMTGKFADILRPLMITCWNGTPSTRPVARVLVETLRPNVVIKDEFESSGACDDTANGYASFASKVSTPVSYLRMGSATDSVDRGRTLSRARQTTTPSVSSTVFRPLQSRADRDQPSDTPSLPSTSKSKPEGVFLKPDWQRPPRILIVDNTSSFQEFGKNLLEDYGCIVEQAHDGAQAMGICDWNHTRFDLVFMVCSPASVFILENAGS